MAKLPAIQFYPGDWKKDPGVQSLNLEERGFWLEILLIMWELPERGKLKLNGTPLSAEDLTMMIPCVNVAKAQQTLSKLLSKGVASQEADGTIINRRMVSDEKLRLLRASSGSLGGKQKASKRLASAKQKATPSVSSSVSSSFTTDKKTTVYRHTPPSPFSRPTAEQVEEYAQTLGYALNGAKFVAHYESKGWKVGSAPMKSWQAAVRTWKISDDERKVSVNPPKKKESNYDWDAPYR